MSTTVTSVRVGLRRDEPVATEPRPRLQWRVETDVAPWVQRSAEIELHVGETTRTHLHTSAESVAVAWPFDPLAPRERVRLRVRVTGSDGLTSDWSAPTEVVAGFLAPDEWSASFVGLPAPTRPAQPALLRTEFDLPLPVASAVLYATAHGVFDVEVNGRAAGSGVLAPGWTAYQARLALDATEITGLLRPGRNALGILLAGGWYCLQNYGEQPSVAAQLVIELVDGTRLTVTTDETWSAWADGPVVAASLYDGETYDRRLEPAGWSSADFDDTEWAPARRHACSVVPVATPMPRSRRIEELPVREVVSDAEGRVVVDFGQNIVGWARVDVEGPAGTTIGLRYGEVRQVLDDPAVFRQILHGAQVTDRLILDGTAVTWEPRFTFHGFRYLEITGWPGPFDPVAVTGIVVHSDMVRTGWFSSSSALLNRFHENAVWSMRGNFLALPTDCPQRAERRGWTGDAQLFAPTATFLYDCEGFLRSWLRDLSIEQAASGYVPVVIPAHPQPNGRRWPGPTAGWSDAATVVPNVLYEGFGDPEVLRAQLASMRAHVDSLVAAAGEDRIWRGGYHFGDWLDPTAPPETPSAAKADQDLLATAFFFRSADLLARAADVLGETTLADEAAALAEEIRQAWVDEFVTPAGRTMSDAQTAYALALHFGIERDPRKRAAMGERLAELVHEAGYSIGTGLLGTPYLTEALASTGHLGVAARLMLQTRSPSWLSPVTLGATTIWERWDSLLPDGSVNPSEMTSFNHYALGAVADWLHRTVAGLAPAAPGYRAIRVAPRPIPGLEHAHARLDTAYGPAEAGWALDASGGITVTAVIPPNATAVLDLPGAPEERVGSGTHVRTIPDSRGESPPALLPTTRIHRALLDEEAFAAVMAELGRDERAADFADRVVYTPLLPLQALLAQELGLSPERVAAAIAAASNRGGMSR
jgi:alpha-L-rhamnosidase